MAGEDEAQALSGGQYLGVNDRAWMELFERHDILEQVNRAGTLTISAEQIHQSGREPRLMTKFDQSVSRPALFRTHGLSILPVSRGEYVIGRFKAYQDLPAACGDIVRKPFPKHIESIDIESITSEAAALNCAFVSGILQDFLQDEAILPTVSGRMRSGSFSFRLNATGSRNSAELTVVNSQVEVDGGYEGTNQLALVEAKNYLAEDFLVRQLYYPFRLWTERIHKAVRPVFVVYSNGIYRLYEYQFQEVENYSSLALVQQKSYSLTVEPISIEDIRAVLARIVMVAEPELPFPQADDFERVVNLCEILVEEDFIRDEIAVNYAFDPRQADYYANAGRYLGLLDRRRDDGQTVYFLTEEGRRLFRARHKTRQLLFAEAVLRHRPFAETLRFYLRHCRMPAYEEIVAIMRETGLHRVNAESTFRRRAVTIARWVEWILGLTSVRA